MKKTIIILYVKDQQKSRDFYKDVLEKAPILDVPGMTEFELGENILLGLMPESSIIKILENNTPDPSTGSGIPRCELYLPVKDPVLLLKRAIKSGGKLVSEVAPRSWGDKAGYCMDPDGHIIAFAE
jgi:uncharacterized glyoxalase superfamily protein PhnB